VPSRPPKIETTASADAVAVPGGSFAPASDKAYEILAKVSGIERSITYLEAHAETADKKLDQITIDIATAKATFTTLKWVVGVTVAGVWGVILTIVAAWAKHHFGS
jgi:hypothetical protein